VKTLLIYSDGDAGIDEFSGHFGSGEKAFSLYPGTSVAYLVGADHNLTPRNARAQATNLIASFVTGRDEAIAGAKRHLGFCK
jgi:hypothetical protein